MKFSDLFLRTRLTLNKHSPAVTLVALVILSITAADIVQQIRRPKFNTVEVEAYYYDLETDRLFVGKSASLPPIAGPGSTGPEDLTAVRAFVFACHDCNDTHDRYIGWVEGFSQEAREAFQRSMSEDPSPDAPFNGYAGPVGAPPLPVMGPDGTPSPLGPPAPGIVEPPGLPFAPMFVRGHLIAHPEENDPTWKDRFFDFSSPEAMDIIRKSQQHCGGRPISCVP